MYTKLADVKNYLDIEGTSCDAEISQLISWIEAEINSILDIDGFNSETTTDTIALKDVYVYNGSYSALYLRNFNVKTVTQLNGSAYTGILNTDYKVLNSREVRIKDLSNYSSNADFGSVDITYTYWRDSIPDDIQLLAKLMVAKKYKMNNPGYSRSDGKMNMEGVSEYQLADERIKYSQWHNIPWSVNIDKLNMDEEAQIKRILATYKKAYVV